MTEFKSEFKALTNRWTDEPADLQFLRNQAFGRFNELGVPTRAWEEWQYSDFSKIESSGFRLTTADDLPSVSENSLAQISDTYKIVILNGHYQEPLSDLPQEITVQSLLNVFQSEPTAIQNGTASESNPFLVLNTAFMNSGLAIGIPDETVIDRPIHLLYFTTDIAEPIMNHPRFLIRLGNQAEVTIIEHYLGKTEIRYFQNVVTKISVGENSHLNHIRIQEEGPAASHISATHYTLEASAQVRGMHFASGSKLYRQNISVGLNGEGAEANLNGLCLSDETQHLDHYVLVDHNQPHCGSRQLFKYILADKSSGAFNGRIIVRPDSQKTDANQTNKNLLLSKSALMNSNPQLEIYADDVKCAHGSTSGQVDSEAIFYMQSRGIKKDKARLLLINGFATEVIQKVRDDATQDYLDNRLHEWLDKQDIAS